MASLPGENDVARALEYLASTDEAEAQARGRVKSMDERKKLILALEFDQAQGSAAERQKKAEASKAYREHCDDYENAVADHALLQNKRARAMTMIDVWRSLNASRRNGNM